MTDPTNSGRSELTTTLVLNALADLQADEPAILDEDSTAVVRDAYRAATTADQRDAFEAALADAAELPDGETIAPETFQNVIDPVVTAAWDRLVAASVRATVLHDATLAVSPRDATLYTFSVTRDADALDDLSLPDGCRDPVREGASHVADGALAAAAAAFERAVDACGAGAGGVSTRVLAALAHHWAGADDDALDLVDEALAFDRNAWVAATIGDAATDDFSDLFRRGTFGPRAYVRVTADVPADGSVSVFARTSEAESWEPLPGTLDCMPIKRLEARTDLRIELSGSLSAFPTLHAYHVSVGAVNLNDLVARGVTKVLLSGPATSGATERLRFERAD